MNMIQRIRKKERKKMDLHHTRKRVIVKRKKNNNSVEKGRATRSLAKRGPLARKSKAAR